MAEKMIEKQEHLILHKLNTLSEAELYNQRQ